MDSELLASLATLFAGALLGFVPTYLLERSRRRHELATRWDTPLYEVCLDFAASARLLAHLASPRHRVGTPTEQLARIDEVHSRLRALNEQIRLLGSGPLQEAATLVKHHAYAIRYTADGSPDVRLKDYPGTTPLGRMKSALALFYVAAREQLGVPHPNKVASDDVLPDEPWTMP